MNNVCDETTKIFHAESHEQLINTRDAELNKLMKIRIIIKELRRLKVPEGHEQIKRTLKLLTIKDYIHQGDKEDEYLLDLHDSCQQQLSYTECKSLRQQLITNLRSKLSIIAEFGQKMRDELPDLFVPSTATTNTIGSNNDFLEDVKDFSQLSMQQKEIIELEVQRYKNVQKLLELHQHKCQLLLNAIELKMGPYLANVVELENSQARLNQVKTNLLNDCFLKEIFSRAEHSLKAFKEVEGYINEKLAKINAEQ